MTAAEEKELALIDIGIRLTWDSDGLSQNASPRGSVRPLCTTMSDQPKAPEALKVCYRWEAEEAWGRREHLNKNMLKLQKQSNKIKVGKQEQ